MTTTRHDVRIRGQPVRVEDDPFARYDQNGHRLTDGQMCHLAGRVLAPQVLDDPDHSGFSLRSLLRGGGK